jgi:hypothetical protein
MEDARVNLAGKLLGRPAKTHCGALGLCRRYLLQTAGFHGDSDRAWASAEHLIYTHV